MNRVLLYVHFNKYDNLAEHVVYQLQQLRPLFNRVVFITNSRISLKDRKRLDGLYDNFIQRENIGFDFAAWRDGIKDIGWNNLEEYSSLTLMNDTCFGPIYSMRQIYEKMEKESVDFWGITDHAANIVGMPGSDGPIPYHIQSYLQVFSPNVVRSRVFHDFWDDIQDYKNVANVIQEYETQLTAKLRASEFTCGVFFNTREYSKKHHISDIHNYSEFLPTILVKSGVPLIKIKSFKHTNLKRIMRQIKATSYPTHLILNYLEEMDIVRINSRRLLLRGRVMHTANRLRKSGAVRALARKSPTTVKLAKKVVRRFLGEMPTAQRTPERKKEYLLKEVYNSYLSQNFAEHTILLQDNKILWHEKESQNHYTRAENDPRVVAIYLPQFHPFRENDQAWGRGFTEWANVTASVPRFVGQQQPVLPSDLGFYDLRLPDIIKQQIDLAKKYGIYGFQLYYYWFSGKKVMDLPINTILKNKDWDFHFSICWANENWTRKWDGGDDDIIFEQKNNTDDPLRFIKDVAPILNDSRYIHENGKPILTVYRVDLLDDAKRYAETWRNYFKEHYGKDLWLVGCTNFKNFDASSVGFDATMDFTPTASSSSELKPYISDEKFLNDDFIKSNKLLDRLWYGNILDFRFIAKQEIKNLKVNPNFYKTISPSWSNEARRKGANGFTFYNSSPEIFANWLDAILDYDVNVQQKKSPIVFINAWNEWAESAMIEPSTHLGHSSLLRIAEILSKYSHNRSNKSAFVPYGFSYAKSANLAVIVHLFYPNMWPDLAEKLKNINVDFDLYVSTPSQYMGLSIETINEYHKNTNIVAFPNRGRDVLPFITFMNRIRKLNNYEYVLKLHTKKSDHRKDGGEWRDDVLSQLLPHNIGNTIETLSSKSTGAIGPSGHVVSLYKHMGSNRNNVKYLLQKMTDKQYGKIVEDESKYPFFGSTMFWCRSDFLDPLLDLYLMPSDFQAEAAQIDGTTAHAIERILGGILHKIGNRKMYVVNKDGLVNEVDRTSYKKRYRYAK